MSVRAPQVFISYQRTDETFARQVREHLAANGVTTWMDQYDIPVGAYWPDEIDKGLASSDIVVGVLSPDAAESRNVKNEWDWAIQNEKRLVLLQVAPCLIPHRYVSINFIDATGPDSAAALAALSRSIGSATTGDMTGSPIAAPTDILPIPIRHATRVPRPASRVPPFIAGREREQAILGNHLDKLLAGNGSLVLVGGEAGIGKTTLTSWLAAEAEARGAVVLTGGCYDLTTTPPYGPWGEIIRNWPNDRGLPPVPDALWGGEAMARLQSQAALFELAADLLATAGAIQPIVLLLEDLHWADQPSLDLLRYVARLVSGFRIMLVVTYRDDEITRRHPLFQLLPALAREPGAERISLTRLGTEAVGALIASRYDIGGPERERLTAYVQRVTEGNPFFAGEVLRALEESSSIERADASWQVGDLNRVAVPELVRQVVEGRLARLGEDAHRLLQVAAVIGHEVPVDLWIEVSGEDEGMLSETLDRATEARIVEELPRGDGFRFTHALIRETLYEGPGLLRRRVLHRRVGELLAAGTRPDPDVVAHHFQQASDSRAFEWLIQAGDRANRSYAWLIAAERYEQAAAFVADEPERAREYGWLLARVARMIRYTDGARAVRYMEEAARVGEQAGDGWLALWPLFQSGFYLLMDGRAREGVDRMVEIGSRMEVAARDGWLASWTPVALLDEHTKSVIDYMVARGAERPDKAVVLSRSMECVHLAGTGRFREARELAEQLVEVWPPDVEEIQHVIGGQWRNAFADLYHALSMVESALGRPAQAFDAALVALRRYTATLHHLLVSITCDHILDMLIAYRTEDIEQRRRVATDAVDALDKARGAIPADASSNILGATLAILEGSWTETYATLHDVVASIAESRTALLGHVAVASLAEISLRQGRRKETRELIAIMFPDGPDTEPGNGRFVQELAIHDIAAALALDIDDLETARAWLSARDRWMAWSGAVRGQVEGHLGWARYHRQTGDLVAAERRAQTAFDKASNPRQPLGLIASHRLLGELATERGHHDSARSHLSDSLALADACAAPFERALTLVALAEQALKSGADPRDMLAEARTICERLEARPALERIAALEQQRAGGGAQ